MTIYFNISLIYFFSGEFSEALHWSNTIRQHPQTELRQDIQDLIRVLLPVIHYELGNTDTLESLLRSAQRHLNRHDNSRGFELCVVSHLHRINNTADDGKKEVHFESLRKELHNYQTASAGSHLLGLTELLLWVENKIRRVSIEEVFRRAIEAS